MTTVEPTDPDLVGALRAAVLGGDGTLVSDGRLLPERQLMEVWGVGRRTVRQALERLEAEGLVFRRQGQGTFVKPALPASRVGGLSARTSPAEIMEVRREVEPALAKLAALRATPDDIVDLRRLAELGGRAETGPLYERWDGAFHAKIAECVRNSLFEGLFAMIAAVRVEQKWTTLRTKVFSAEVRDALIAQHVGIVDAIASRDPDAAEAAMRAHIGLVGDLVGTSG